MKYLNTSIKSLLACLIILALGSSLSFAAPGGWGGGGGRTPIPTVSLSASPSTIDEAQSATLSWSSTDANSCSASWTDSSATSGSQSVSPSVTTTYSIICNGDGGSANDSVTLTVTVNITGGGSDGDYIGGRNDTQVFDTSFAVEFSYSCLSGGCHETNQNLVDEYAASKMTHVMVKCNACHGTHTADTIGMEKPNLTGYYPGIGATGYRVDTDRCKACHNNEHTGYGNKSGDNCYSCHTPHVFGAGGGGGGGGGGSGW